MIGDDDDDDIDGGGDDVEKGIMAIEKLRHFSSAHEISAPPGKAEGGGQEWKLREPRWAETFLSGMARFSHGRGGGAGIS